MLWLLPWYATVKQGVTRDDASVKLLVFHAHPGAILGSRVITVAEKLLMLNLKVKVKVKVKVVKFC